MKRFMMTAVAALLFSAVAGYNYYQHSQIDPRILENAAALSGIPPEGRWDVDYYTTPLGVGTECTLGGENVCPFIT